MPRLQRKTIYNAKDRIIDGAWQSAYVENEIYHSTRGFNLWNGMKSRINAQTKRNSSYSDSNILFDGFQSFMNWCHKEDGYLSREPNGNYWSLDKDIIVPFNKDYSPDTCCFVPIKVNTLLTARTKDRGNLPLGVSEDKGRGDCPIKYRAFCSADGKQLSLGRSWCKMEAHKLWQNAKIEQLMRVSLDESLPYKARKGLIKHADLIRSDLENNIETVR